jgi:hypothetical protein
VGYYDPDTDEWYEGVADVLSGQWIPVDASRGTGARDCPPGFPVKGNLPSQLYHLPGAPTYERTVPEDHYGTIVPFHLGDEDIDHEVAALVKRFPKMPFDSYAAWRTPDALLKRIDDYVEAGITKFVMRPMATGAALYEQFERLAKVTVPHYHG